MRCLRLVPLLAAALVAGCGGGDDDDIAQVRTTSLPPRAQPGPERPPERVGSAAATVVRYSKYVQAGALLSAAALYDARVRSAVDPKNFAGGLQSQTGPNLRVLPRVVADRRWDELHRVVVLETVDSAEERRKESFLVRPTRAGWRIVYDTGLEHAMRRYGVTAGNFHRDAGDDSRAERAERSAVGAAGRFQQAALARTRPKGDNLLPAPGATEPP